MRRGQGAVLQNTDVFRESREFPGRDPEEEQGVRMEENQQNAVLKYWAQMQLTGQARC